MAIDMKTVKEIEFNNKQVKKIEDNNGNILWQKKSATTVTITLTNLKYINLYRLYKTSVGSGVLRTLYAHLNYLNITGISDNRDTDTFVLLPLSVYTDIKNKVYTSDTTITGENTFRTRPNINFSYVICYVSNNELYSVGNINYATANGIVGTTSELSNTVAYDYQSASMTPSWDSAYFLRNTTSQLCISASSNAIVRNVANPIASSSYGSTNGGVQPTLTAASGTMTIQYTI